MSGTVNKYEWVEAAKTMIMYLYRLRGKRLSFVNGIVALVAFVLVIAALFCPQRAAFTPYLTALKEKWIVRSVFFFFAGRGQTVEDMLLNFGSLVLCTRCAHRTLMPLISQESEKSMKLFDFVCPLTISRVQMKLK